MSVSDSSVVTTLTTTWSKFVQFSGKVDWETTVQSLETCLWNRQKNKANAFLTHLRCLYYINGNINHIPTSTLQSQYDRLCYHSSSVTSSSSSPTSSAHSIGEGGVLEEPRRKELTLPRWGPHRSFYSFYTMDGTYLNSLIVPLVDQLPYLVQFYPRSLSHERFLEDEFGGAVAAAGIADGYTESEDYTISGRGPRGNSIRKSAEENMKPEKECYCPVCNPVEEGEEVEE